MEGLRAVDEQLFWFFHLHNNPHWLWQSLSITGLAHYQFGALLVGLAYQKKGWVGSGIAALLILLILFLTDGMDVMRLASFAALVALLWHSTHKGPLIAATALGGILHLAIKQAIFRERPSLLVGSHPLEDVYLQWSFPSGHTSTSLALGVAAALLLKNRLGFGILGWSIMVAISRISNGVHWPSDVLAGACLGCVAAAAVTLYCQAKSTKPENE